MAQNLDIELELGAPQEVSLAEQGVWYFKPQSPNQVIRASLNQSMNNPWSSKDFGGKLPVSVGASGLTIWIEVVELAGAPTCQVFYTNAFGQSFFSQGGGSGNYTFSSPLSATNSNVVLNIANDLQVSGGNLTLDLQNNSDFSSLSSLVQSLTSGVEIIGQIPNSNAEVLANTDLLTLFVDTEKGRAPRGGDVILTTEANSNPAYVWLYTSTGAWAGIGTAGAGIATQNTLGLIKGSSTISIASDGTASVNGVALLSGGNTFTGSNTFPDATTTSNPLTFSTLFKDSTFTPTTSNIPNGGGVFVMN